MQREVTDCTSILILFELLKYQVLPIFGNKDSLSFVYVFVCFISAILAVAREGNYTRSWNYRRHELPAIGVVNTTLVLLESKKFS